MFSTLLLTISRILRVAWQSVSSRFPPLRGGIAVEATKRLRVHGRLNGIIDENLQTLRNERLTSAEWVGAENRPSGSRLTGLEISMGKESAAVALPKLLDLIEHCREAPRPTL